MAAIFVRTETRDGVSVITVDNPPVNALSPGVAEAIVTAVQAANADAAVAAMVVIGAGRTFIAGADIKMFPKIVCGELPPLRLAALLNEIENSPKPVVMAIHGTALGGGLETAMAGHYRIASPDARFGQPEVKLGLIPGAGGTQRLPRLCGMQKALEMCAYGEPVTAADALSWGLLDKIAEGDLLAEALAYARTVTRPRQTRDLAVPPMDAGEFAAFRAAVERKFRGQTAPRLAADAVAASTLPFDEGLERERVLFEETLHGPQSKALIHVFFAEREVAKIPDIPKETPLLPVMRAAVVGCGTMGMGIVLNFASAGIPVLVKEDTPHALERGLAGIRALYDAQVVKGRLSREDADKRFSLITPTLTWDWFASADIVVEAVYESLALKKHIFADLDKVAKPGAILATNTSTLDVDDIAAATSRAAYVCGMHFFSPANVMKLVEVIRGKYTNPSVVATVMDLARRLRKTAVLSGNCFGFIGNRMFEPYRREAVRCVEEGASPSQVDKALTDWGMAMGPIAVADLVGLDTLWLIHRAYEAPGSFEDTLYQRGRYGQKSNAGWYLYDEKRRAIPDPAVDSMLREYAAVQGIPQRTFTDEEVVDRCLSALAREGRDILDEKIALRASDIDVVYVHGYGFPAWRGGPMFHAGLR